MEENSESVTSTQKKLLSSHDPGWNDPPAWALAQAQKPSGTPTKRLLNKRVAFPLNSKPSDSSNAVPTQNLPPIPNVLPPVNACSMTTAPHKPYFAPTAIAAGTADIEIDKDQALKDTLKNLQSVLKQLELSKVEEIKKRLERMEAMWNEDKLDSAVHKKLLDISTALSEDNVEEADKLHISLMVNSASVCSSWIPGVRQLITEIRNKKNVI